MEEKNPVLCGFIWCHGFHNFAVWETDAISAEDRTKIEEILNKYVNYGTSVGNVYEESFSELFREEY